MDNTMVKNDKAQRLHEARGGRGVDGISSKALPVPSSSSSREGESGAWTVA